MGNCSTVDQNPNNEVKIQKDIREAQILPTLSRKTLSE